MNIYEKIKVMVLGFLSVLLVMSIGLLPLVLAVPSSFMLVLAIYFVYQYPTSTDSWQGPSK